MPFIKVGQENSRPVELHYEDHGSGRPVVLIHGYPLNGDSWEKQERALLETGHRVITYDRRGFGRSSRPVGGYDYDTFAADLNALLERLDLLEVTLVGFSMGSGEVTRYLGAYGSGRVSKAVLIAPLQPYLLRTEDNPAGLDASVFENTMKAAEADRFAFLKSFLDDFYNMDVLGGTLVSEQAWQASFQVAAAASATATVKSVPTWATDFRGDLAAFDVPTLVIQGDQDRILPIDATGNRLEGLIEDLRYVVVEGGPHAIGWTHADQVNAALLDFLK
ncbi:alpha/beta hydrolase [Nonomuraea sp. NPDC050310]|uniref:alpha/beta fold hydrolase n=1 Tax=unclassified Nonomuraea TaxID=2593643 RepID=UPI0033C52112